MLKMDGYNNALIGTTHDGRLVYDYNKLVESIVRNDGMSELEAVEYIEYNIIRSLPYLGNEAPIILIPQGMIRDEKTSHSFAEECLRELIGG